MSPAHESQRAVGVDRARGDAVHRLDETAAGHFDEQFAARRSNQRGFDDVASCSAKTGLLR